MLKTKLNTTLARFLIVGGVSYVLWLLLYYIVIKTYTNWDYLLNKNIGDLSVKFLNWFNYSAVMELDSDHVIVSLPYSNYRGVWVGDNCNGFKLFSIFSIFIIAFPAKFNPSAIKSKFWFIPLGILVVHLANIIRVMALVLINDKNPEFLDFNHDYTFTIFVYAIIFGLWYWWLKKYTSVHEK